MKASILIENQYFPVVNWFKSSFSGKYIFIPSCESWQKMSFRNRTVICGSNGLINLSIPIEAGRNQHLPYRDIKISYRYNWQANHWRSIFSSYGRSPFFDFYGDAVQNLLTRKDVYLFDLNIVIAGWLIKTLKMQCKIKIVENMQEIENDDNVENILNKWLPKNYQQGTGFITYRQVFEDKIGFQPNVSILDLLFNTGPQAAAILQSA